MSEDKKFIEDSLKLYRSASFETALDEEFDARFLAVLRSAHGGKMTPGRAKGELRRILRGDFVSKIRKIPQFAIDEKQSLAQWTGKLGGQAPSWLLKYLSKHPSVAKQGTLRLSAIKNHLPPKEILKTYGFHLLVDNAVILERFLQLPAGALSQRGDLLSVTILPDELFEKVTSLLCARPVQLHTTAQVSRPAEMIRLRKKDHWPELLTSAMARGLHEHDRHPYVSLYHDRQLHFSLLNSFAPELREDLVRLAKVVESLPATVKSLLGDHIAEEILEGVFLAPSIKEGKIVFDTTSPHRKAILFILRAGKVKGKYSEKLARHLHAALGKVSFKLLKRK